MTIWASKWAFIFFIPLIAVAAWRIWNERRNRPALQFSSLSFIKKLRPSLRTRLKWLPALMYVVSLACAVMALARPQRADTKVKKNVEGIDIVLALDISDSMAIEDMPPHKNRIDAAQFVLKDFVKNRVNDRIGYVVFMGEAYTKVPLTLDHGLLIKSIEETFPSRNIKMGTAIGSALATAVGRIKDSTAKTRVIVFATDGESNSGTIDPETALEIAKGYGIRIYTIGMGKDGESMLPIETLDVFGRKKKTYQPIHSSVNDELLGKMASETGGKYFRATDGTALEKVFSAIDHLEKSKIDVNQYTKYAELFPPYLQAAVWIFLIALFLGQTILRRVP
jgi:Ca-activated chloride channel family protein